MHTFQLDFNTQSINLVSIYTKSFFISSTVFFISPNGNMLSTTSACTIFFTCSAHPSPGRTHQLPVRPHHPGGLRTLQEMPPPYTQGHASGLVPGRNPTTTRRLAHPQPRTPGHRTFLQGSAGQGSHHERGIDTGPTPTPRQTHGKPHGGSSAPPARSSPQSSGRNGTLQTPSVNTRGTTHHPQHQGIHAASHPLPCRA